MLLKVQPSGVFFRLLLLVGWFCFVELSGVTMKKIVIFLAYSLALTLVLYEIADYLTPGSPSEGMTLLLAGIAIVLVWVAQCSIRITRPKKDGAQTVH